MLQPQAWRREVAHHRADSAQCCSCRPALRSHVERARTSSLGPPWPSLRSQWLYLHVAKRPPEKVECSYTSLQACSRLPGKFAALPADCASRIWAETEPYLVLRQQLSGVLA